MAPKPLEQLNLTNDETIYLWYRRNISLTQPSEHSVIEVQTRIANSLLFFLDGQFLGNYDQRSHDQGTVTVNVTLNLTQFHPNQPYLLEILSVSLGIDNYNIGPGHFEYKGIVGNISIDGQSLISNDTNVWEHQKGLAGEAAQIYTEEGSKTVQWNPQWTIAINKSVTWFQSRFDLDRLARQDLNANPVLVNASGLNRGHLFVNGNDLGLYWLITVHCQVAGFGHHLQGGTTCNQPSQQYYHIPPDWLMPKNNLLTVFEDLGASSPGSVNIVQRLTFP